MCDLQYRIEYGTQTIFAFSSIINKQFYNFPLGIGQIGKALTSLVEVAFRIAIVIYDFATTSYMTDPLLPTP
jgi:hypothetical protein